VCGIVGIWNRDGRPVDRAALRGAVTRLAHRGPDDEGYVLIDTRSGRAVACRGVDTRVGGLPRLDEPAGGFDLALGHRRLAIVDESVAGHQPMSTANGRLWIAFNGMVYNFRELRRELEGSGVRFVSDSDTEVILKAYERWGADCVGRFNGMWAFVLWDARAGTLVVSRDRIGIKPLVYRIDDRRALFASEVSALGPFGALDDGIEPRALHHYLSLMEVPAPYTIHKHVRKLDPARTLTITSAGHREQRFWQPTLGAHAATNGNVDDACDELDALIADAVRLRLVADVPVGCFVSGGIDSGTVAAHAAAQRNGRPLPTYSITVPWNARIDESPWSRAIAGHLGSDHTEIALRAEDFDDLIDLMASAGEPFAVSSVLGVALIARAARPSVKVLLSGDGGDELFAGYAQRHYDIDNRWDGFRDDLLGRLRPERALAAGQFIRWRGRTPATMRRLRLQSLFVPASAGRDVHATRLRCMFNDSEKHALYARAWRAGYGGEDTIPWLRSRLPARNGDRVLRRQLHDVDTMLHDEMTAKLDLGTMAWGIEGRVPVLDHRVVERAMSLPLPYRVREGEGKWLLRRVAARHLPPEILTRPKRGFTIPIDPWLRTERRELVYDTLAASRVRRTGIFDPAAVADVLAYYEREPHFHTAHMVLTLLCFQLWSDRRSEVVR
jgi:asparagine synthase (glutamine-hydrolysing)